MEGLKQILREFSYSHEPTIGFTDYENMPKELFQFIRQRYGKRHRISPTPTDTSIRRRQHFIVPQCFRFPYAGELFAPWADQALKYLSVGRSADRPADGNAYLVRRTISRRL